MESRIPLPTDNIFKFYALFGLLLFIFGFSASIYATKVSNEFMATAVVDLEELTAVVAPSARDAARKKVLERQIEVTKSDRETFKWGSVAIASIGMLGIMFGFGKWHSEIQPRLDEIGELQLLKLRHEVREQNSALRRRPLKVR